MITILFLDDDAIRHLIVARFFRHTKDVQVVHANSVADAVLTFASSPVFTLASLDFDLDLADPLDMTKSGLAVARWIATHPAKAPLWVHLHSQNEVGTRMMLKALEKATWLENLTDSPFAPTRGYWRRIESFLREVVAP